MKKNIIKKGERFNELIIIKEIKPHIKPNGNKERKVLCQCACGNKKEILYNSIKSGQTKSCGCLLKKFIIKKFTKHGMRQTRFYNILIGARSRCNNKKDTAYKNYGGRGITICKEWMEFENFRNDMYKSYKEHCKKYSEKQTTLDRIDNNGNYELKNCRWATYKKQAKDKKRNKTGQFIKDVGIKKTKRRSR